MNIEKWDRKIFDWPMEYFIGYHWKLEVTGDGINAVCRGSDNLPNDWGAFRIFWESRIQDFHSNESQLVNSNGQFLT